MPFRPRCRRPQTALDERLANATKLADSKVVGAPQVMARITAMGECIKRLDEAYKAYRAEITEAPGTEAEAAPHARCRDRRREGRRQQDSRDLRLATREGPIK